MSSKQLWQLLRRYLPTVARSEWRLGLLALVALAPGVAALTAWSHLALLLPDREVGQLAGWLLPPWLLDAIGASGVLVGAGMVTLLIGCLTLTSLYIASIERRLPELALLHALGLRHRPLLALVLVEALATGAVGSVAGSILGLAVSRVSWSSASLFF